MDAAGWPECILWCGVDWFVRVVGLCGVELSVMDVDDGEKECGPVTGGEVTQVDIAVR